MAWHARKSASGSKQWLKCPGSLVYVASLPDNMRRGTNDAAMTGTAAHALGEYCLRQGYRDVPMDLYDRNIWLDENEDAHIDGVFEFEGQYGFQDLSLEGCETTSQASAALGGVEVKFLTPIDEKMRDGVQVYLDTVWGKFDELGDGTDMFVERTFDMDWLRPDLGGTSDCTLWQFLGKLCVIDYKNGYVAVSATDNTQALVYALGIAHSVDWLFEELEVVIVQPNAQGPSVKSWTVSKEELEAFQTRLAEGSDAVDEAAEAFQAVTDQVDFIEWAGTHLNAGEDDDNGHCTYCDAFAVCPAARAKAEELAVADFNDDPPKGNPLEVHDDQALDRLVRLIKWGGFLDNLVKAAQTLGQRRLEQGLEVPGHKLVHGKANRVYACTDDEIVTLMTSKGFKAEDLFEEPKPPKLKSPAQMEKLGAARSKERKLAKEMVEELAHKPLGKLTMAPDDDPREAVTLGDSAAGDFADEEVPE